MLRQLPPSSSNFISLYSYHSTPEYVICEQLEFAGCFAYGDEHLSFIKASDFKD
jgi:hypothetical protein